MHAPLAAQFVLEVPHGVRHEDALAIDSGGGEGTIEQLPRGADERAPLQVFLVAGLLAHEHEAW